MNGATVVEIAPRTWRVESLIGTRNLFQYVLADGDGNSLVIDTGTSATPRDAILPALRHTGLAPEAVAYVVVTHPDLDHQGGLAGLRDVMPSMVACCGFADRGLVENPERLITDRYGAYEHPHGLGYTTAEKDWMREFYGRPTTIDLGFGGGEEIRLGDRLIHVYHAPGHAAGHLILHDSANGLLFTSDAVHWQMCPAADGTPALPPTYDDVDPYLTTIDLVESLAPSTLHSGHWPEQHGETVAIFCEESRAFVDRMDGSILSRLGEPATLREICDHLNATLGPFGCDPVNLMFAAHGHMTRLLRRGVVELVDLREEPPRFRRMAEG